MPYQQLLEEYAQGADLLANAISSMTSEQLDASPIPGKWSTRQVVCHLTDFEPIYADRIKRALVEDNPTLMGGDPDVFANGLGYEVRDLNNELNIIRTTRQQLLTVLENCDDAAFQRTGQHSRDGDLTIETLLKRITGHIPHHIKTIEEKKQALGV
ncbi:DinB family protein [Rubinisphaera italica]|uniref:Putative metal-dependent hydrolase YfiT n=1 Tax=Rubinisphaera italica TaxID=2527969 RepID=A0A5C5XBP6_9PLAN|nr:DinB family protein [Rubinisphaera italica]TWT60208.1 putative metal-dependent hydrolase YfiT [Rubinisphaera italica]